MLGGGQMLAALVQRPSKALTARFVRHASAPGEHHDWHDLNVWKGGTGNCYDNTGVETVFNTIKDELLWQTPLQSSPDAKVAILECINGFDNPRWRHSAPCWTSLLAFERKAA